MIEFNRICLTITVKEYAIVPYLEKIKDFCMILICFWKTLKQI